MLDTLNALVLNPLLHLSTLAATSTAYSADKILLYSTHRCAEPDLHFLEKVKFIDNEADFFLHAYSLCAVLELPYEHSDLRV